MKNFELPTLFVILAIAVFLRLYQIDSVPPSPSLDEVSIGYNAYSLLHTGKDEYGETFPILLRAYDDWRPALYAYLTTPFVKVFGLTTVAVRLPSVILSILTVLACYFLIIELMQIAKVRANTKLIAFITTFLLAISPWHIYISRLGHEANAGLAFFVLAVLFFLKYKFYVASIFFVLSFISYQAEKVVIPFIVVGLAVLFRKELLVRKKQVMFASLIGLVVLIPFIGATLSPNALIRFEATSIFNAQQGRFEKQAIRLAEAVREGDIIGQIIHNRRVLGAQVMLEGYVSHFNPTWLFTNFSEDRHKVPGLGLLYLWEAPLIILGVIVLARKKFDHKFKILLMLWFFSAPLPAALTTDAPHAMRSYTFLPIWQILSSIGLMFLFNLSKNRYSKSALLLAFGLILVGSLIYFYKQYFVIFPIAQSQSFQYALSETIPFVSQIEGDYKKIIFSNRDNLYQSYMFFLFYSRYDPILYQKQGGTISGGFAEFHTIGKFVFRRINWEREERNKNILYVGNPSDFPESIKPLFLGYYRSGEIGVKIVEGQ